MEADDHLPGEPARHPGRYDELNVFGTHTGRTIEAERERCHASDFTLRGLIGELAERGLKVGYRSVWTFVHAEGLRYKKIHHRTRTGSS